MEPCASAGIPLPMYSFRNSLLRVLFHALVAVPLGIWGVGLLICSDFVGLIPMMAAAIILAFPVAELLAEPASGLFYPGGTPEKPPPMYSIPESKRARGLYEEAMDGMEEIVRKFPGEVRPYITMIEIAIVDLKDPERASAVYDRGMAALSRTADRHALTQMYLGNCSRLTDRPEWLTREQERVLSLQNVQLAEPTVPKHFRNPNIRQN